MRKFILVAVAVFAILQSDMPVQAQHSGTETEIIFTEQKKEEARQQLRRLLSEYDLDPWIFRERSEL